MLTGRPLLQVPTLIESSTPHPPGPHRVGVMNLVNPSTLQYR